MRDSDGVRDRAARLRALALKAEDDGKLLLAAEIRRLAAEARDQADEMDRREDLVQHEQSAHEPEHQQPAQQQQQPQSEGDKE
jgi:hypothetical protein